MSTGAVSSLIDYLQPFAALTGALVAHAVGATAWPLVIRIALPGVAALAIWARENGGGVGRAEWSNMTIFPRIEIRVAVQDPSD